MWEDVKTLPPEENSQTPLILRSSTDTSYLKDRFFVLVRRNEGERERRQIERAGHGWSGMGLGVWAAEADYWPRTRLGELLGANEGD